MYSSSPYVIKHFIPMNFSKQSLDYQQSPKKQVLPMDQNPFHNKKLRKNMESKPKDCVLIFKNRSCKSFCAKKNIQFIPLLKNMKIAHKNCMIIKQKQQNIYNLLIEKDPYNNFGIRIKPKSSQTKRYYSEKNQYQVPSTATKTRRASLSRDGYQERKKQQNQPSPFFDNKIIEKIFEKKLFQTLKVTGNKAPTSQIVDHWKKVSPSLQFLRIIDGNP